MTIDHQQLTDITLGVCETMLGLELTPRTAALWDWQRHLLASIRISGEWNAILEVSCCESAAKQIAAAMFATDLESVSESEIVNSVAEVANMIGGNIKESGAGGESNLSLPSWILNPLPIHPLPHRRKQTLSLASKELSYISASAQRPAQIACV